MKADFWIFLSLHSVEFGNAFRRAGLAALPFPIESVSFFFHLNTPVLGGIAVRVIKRTIPGRLFVMY
jgi:hypothetical protein